MILNLLVVLTMLAVISSLRILSPASTIYRHKTIVRAGQVLSSSPYVSSPTSVLFMSYSSDNDRRGLNFIANRSSSGPRSFNGENRGPSSYNRDNGNRFDRERSFRPRDDDRNGRSFQRERSPPPAVMEDKNYENQPEVVKQLKRGQEVSFEVLRFGRIGATVRIINGVESDVEVFGVVYQEAIQDYEYKLDCSIRVGDRLQGSISNIRADHKIDIILRPPMSKRLLEVKALILQLLQQEEDMSSLPIGDKSSVDDIQVYLPNISKKDFKAALGALYKEGLVKPADDMIRLMTADEKQEIVSKFKIERDEEFTLFVGNLPAVETEKLKEAIEKAIAPKQLVSLRHIKGPDGTMKHFAYLQLHSKQDMEDVKLQLKGFEIQNRILRIDYANSNKKEEERQSKQSSSVPAASKMNSVDDSLILNASTSPATTAAASPSSSPSSRSSTGRKEYFFPVYVGNLSYKVTEQEIQIFFEKQLQRNVIRKIRLATHPDGEKRGFAYVDVGSEEDYEDMMKCLNGKDFMGRALRIDDGRRNR